MVETPASALSIESICEAGIDFASFGTNDPTQYTLAVDRNNENVADRFDVNSTRPSRTHQQYYRDRREHDVATSIWWAAGSKPEMVRHLVNSGVTSISATSTPSTTSSRRSSASNNDCCWSRFGKSPARPGFLTRLSLS